jgi:hypothetical protein
MLLKTSEKEEFGDFQTPPALAREVCSLLFRRGAAPQSVLEPTCGQGSFIAAALEEFQTIRKAAGVDINERHVISARAATQAFSTNVRIRIQQEDFFTFDWQTLLESLPEPLLVIGNPPWVTSSALGSLRSANLPQKSNFQKHRGIDAITGKSNFDISEWMLLEALEWINGRRATLAMLCKTSVARKVVLHAWKRRQGMSSIDIYRIDAMQYFSASVDACLLVITSDSSRQSFDCQIHDSLDSRPAASVIGYRDERLVANVLSFERWKHIQQGNNPPLYKWRSGIKHDCSRVMELRKTGELYINGFGETVELEDEYLYPMLKSSDIANGNRAESNRWMLVTQRFVGEDTCKIRESAPKTLAYLESHSTLLKRRASSIYRNRPAFSIFGVGKYTFAPWKVAVSGFYKDLRFKVTGPSGGKPMVLDDTCYFLSCHTEDEARYIAGLLNSEVAQDFYSSFIFRDSKRPVTVELLHRLDIQKLAEELDGGEAMNEYLAGRACEIQKEPATAGFNSF